MLRALFCLGPGSEAEVDDASRAGQLKSKCIHDLKALWPPGLIPLSQGLKLSAGGTFVPHSKYEAGHRDPSTKRLSLSLF